MGEANSRASSRALLTTMPSPLRRVFAALYYFAVNMGVLKSTFVIIAMGQFVACHALAIESFDQVSFSFAAMALSATGNKSMEIALDALQNFSQTSASAPFDGAPKLALDLNAATAAMEGTKLDLSNHNLLFASGSVAAIAAMTIILGSAVNTPCEPQEVEDEEEEEEEEDGSPMSFNGLHSLHHALDNMEKKEVSQASWPRLPSPSKLRTLGNALDSDSDEDGNDSDESDTDMFELNHMLELRAKQERNAPLLPASPLSRKTCSHSKRVSFGQVSVRGMQRQPGGGGSVCTHGVPLGISWTVVDEHSLSVDEAEEERTRKGKKHKDVYVIFGRVAAQAREKWLLEAGATKSTLRKSAQMSAKVLRGREESNANLFFQ